MERRLVGSLLLASVLATGCQKPEEPPRAIPERIQHDPDAMVVARVDANVLESPSAQSRPVGTVMEGDLLTVLAQKGEFNQVTVRSTGTTGWLDANLCLYVPPSPYWEGDTTVAREAARKIYQDKFLVQRDDAGTVRFPIHRVKVEAAFNTLTFLADAGQPKPTLPRKDAEELASHWVGRLLELFPDWKDPTVYVKGFDGQADYLLTMSRDKSPNWL